MDFIIEAIQNGLLRIFKLEELVTVFIAILPIVEARLAVPIGIGYNLSWLEAWFYAFIGSSAIVPLLLLVLLPFVNWLSRTKIFRKIGTVIYEKFEKKSKEIKSGDIGEIAKKPYGEMTDEEKKIYNKNENKKYLWLFIFVLIPAPLTGVWTGCAIAAITKLKFAKSCLAIISGNFIASALITLLCVLLPAYVDLITLIIGILAIITVLGLIFKIIFSKSDKNKTKTPKTESGPDKTGE